MPRFVILEHDHPHRHWDLMLETAGVLRTWRLASPPDGPGPIAAEAIGDHRLANLDYEGPVSGGRGTVVRWDRGELDWEKSSEGLVRVRLAGIRVSGPAVLKRNVEGQWVFIVGRDGPGEMNE